MLGFVHLYYDVERGTQLYCDKLLRVLHMNANKMPVLKFITLLGEYGISVNFAKNDNTYILANIDVPTKLHLVVNGLIEDVSSVEPKHRVPLVQGPVTFQSESETLLDSPSLSETGKNLIIHFNQEDEADSILASLAPELMKFSRDICKSESKNHPNILSLWASAVNNGWTEGVWATYRQWEELGCQVKRGEKSSPVVFWDSYTDDQAEPDQSVKRSFAKRYSVFNCAQVEGFCPTTPIETVQNEKIAAAEAFFLNLSSDIRVGGNEAGYSKSGDFIRMPGLRQFLKSEGYYCVLSHEHIHWSGHKDRLNRDLSGRFGDSSYAMEGLIAELGAVFLCSHLGVKTDPREDHAGYVASWLRVLKKDNRAIFTAASAAQKAVDYLVQLSQEEPVLVGKALCLETKRVFNLSS
jgi:antirestriction protein ArdC